LTKIDINTMAGAKILIVEDEVIVSTDLMNILKKMDYVVTSTCTSGEQALQEIERNAPDLVLMDIILKGRMNGIEAAREIRRRFDLPVIFLTAYSNVTYINRAKATEPFGYILKPVDEKILNIPIELALAKHDRYRKQEKEAGQALRESRTRYQQIVKNINEGILMQDRKGKITYANASFLQMIGCDEGEVIGRTIDRFLDQAPPRQKMSNKSDAGDNWIPFETTLKQKDGGQVYAILSPKPIYDEEGRLNGSVAVLTDITERRKMEIELQRSQEELRSLSQYIQSVREKESTRIAREIHDELGQKLTALKMDLSWLSQRIVLSDVGQSKFSEKVGSMSSLIDMTIQTVQKICSELRPGLLDDLGLVPAIEWLAQDFQERTDIQCQTHLICGDQEFDPDISTAVFRISQEALTNVVRHAKASKVTIRLREHDGALELEISDNGRGIKDRDILNPKSLGLMGMRERIWPFGGEFNLKGVFAKGTTLLVRIPTPKADSS
jgi:two-component system sensor histidine kinase UhpB